jgi:UDP-N-acetylglucosamine--N-acetylmuramyl-(pentapeptide) pyrophosphoryl-undecaprenol N-acetylglucosamine transferase
MSAPIIIAAGGTGGHFFPAEALAAELMSRGQTVALMTDARSGGGSSAVFANSERFVLSGAGIAGRGFAKALRGAGALASGTMQARSIIRTLNPSAIVGFGGYPTVAPVLASRSLRRRPRIILHEQNAVLGRANRALSPFSDALALSFAETTKVPARARVTTTGNPVRAAILAHAGHGYTASTDEFRLLILGGSLGARVFSVALPDAIGRLPAEVMARLRITQQCRAEDLDAARAAYLEIGITADLSTFFPNVAELLDRAHLVIARAGASTVAELAAIGRPAILVPLPSAIDDHQRANALALANAGGAWMMHQSIFDGADLADFLAPLIRDGHALAPMAATSAAFARLDATTQLANLVEQTIGSAERAA